MYIGPEKIVLVLVIGLVVLGPERLPHMARQAGRLFREFRRVTSGLDAEVRSAFHEPIRQALAEPREAHSAARPTEPEPSPTVIPTDPVPATAESEDSPASFGDRFTESVGHPAACLEPSGPEPVAPPSRDPKLN